ncbi:pheromone A receptor-domain-containing protein [Cyathus striatus]|nr:pheromone A receptor-domain-containing protein [Cyathus striatus]
MSNHSPVWCDISTHLMVAIDIAISVSALSVALSVHHVTRLRMDTYTKERERIWLIAYLGLGIGMPVLEIALYYLIQDHRYTIIEDVGCELTYAGTPLGYGLILALPLFVSTISLFFCVINLYSLFKTLRNHRLLLAHSSGGLSTSHYARLILLSSCEVITSTPLAAYTIYLSASMNGVQSYNWHTVHDAFSEITYLPSAIWKSDNFARAQVELPRWMIVACAFWLFLFFGTGIESRKNMEKAVKPLFNLFGVKFDRADKKQQKGRVPSLVFAHDNQRSGVSICQWMHKPLSITCRMTTPVIEEESRETVAV